MWTNIDKTIPKEWQNILSHEFKETYWKNLITKLNDDKREILPKIKDVFKAFELCKPNDIKVVILGQDPYINGYEAMGLSFSVPKNIKIPPSLRTIFNELNRSYGLNQTFNSGDLTHWATDGCLMLNTILTVVKGKSGSHKDFGWKHFTGACLRIIQNQFPHVLFVAWGSHAKMMCEKNEISPERTLFAGHPSPLNTKSPFIGCNHFVKINRMLMEKNILPIRWFKDE
jgi:uracil-DNA glycosylase